MANTSSRLKQIMDERGLKQSDILRLAQPYCEQYGVKLGKSDLSQFVSGKVTPGQWKLTILGLALNVSETWLMGLDVPPDRISPDCNVNVEETPHSAYVMSENDTFPQLDELNLYISQLNAQGLQKIIDFAAVLAGNPAYRKSAMEKSQTSDGEKYINKMG
ncbi:MAG: hypothetical protein LUD78_06125 [Clostridiales bacterium]|nr:hypothetical protein [Clostridiales bacterium]